jgi:hypothetical protein
MRHRNPLRDELDRLRSEVNPHARGRALEQFIGRLFRAARFRVEIDPGVASPRQKTC